MRKALGEYGTGILQNLINNLWISKNIPTDWKTGVIIRVAKKVI